MAKKVEELTEEEINDMSEEELAKAGEGDDTQKASSEETSDSETTPEEKETSESEEEISDEKKESSEDEETLETEEKETSEEKKLTPEEKAEKRVKDAQRKMHEKAQEAAKLRREKSELEKKLLESKKPKEPQQYSQEELEELKEVDPEKWHQILREREEYDRRKTEFERDSQSFEHNQVEDQQKIAAETQLHHLLQFAGEMGIEVDETVPLSEQPKEAQDFFNSPELKQVDDFLSKHSNLRSSDGTYSPEVIRMVYRDMHFDKLSASERKKAYQQSKENIENAGKTGSKLEKTTADTGMKHRKKLEDLTPEEIESMPEEEIKTWAEEINTS